MPLPNEATSAVAAGLSGKNVRLIEVVTPIGGVLTPVEMQVVSIADAAGNVIDDFANYKIQTAILSELRAIRSLLARQNGEFAPVLETLSSSL